MSRLSELLSQSAQAVLRKAQTYADRRSEELNSVHVVKALYEVDRTMAYDTLRALNLPGVSLLKAPKVKGVQELPQLVERAARIARAYGFTHVEPEHLLFVLTSHDYFAGYQLLKQLGVNLMDLREQLGEWLYGVSLLKSVSHIVSGQENREGEETKATNSPGVASLKSSSLLASCTTDLTAQAAKGKLDPVVQRETELNNLIRTLLRRKKNNPLLIGEPGIGKTALVHGLARRIAQQRVPLRLTETRLLELSVPALVAGTMYRGQFEERVKALLNELKQQRQTVLFIDEIHTLSGTGSTEGTLDLANMLKPALASGDISVIGATTYEEYNRYFASDRALERRFQPLYINEPTPEQALAMIKSFVPHLERHHGVKIDPATVEAAVTLSMRYLPDRFLPDKAIDVLDEACAGSHTIVTANSVAIRLKRQLASIMEHKNSLVDQGQLKEASTLRLQEQKLMKQLLATPTTEIGGAETVIMPFHLATVISQITKVPLAYISADPTESLDTEHIKKRLRRHLVGQNSAIDAIVSALTRAQVGLHDHTRPLASFIFIGPTGVGKTESARILAREIFGSPDALIKIDMSEFGEAHTISQFVGSPKGYVGHEDGGTLVEKVRQRPYSVILFDEVEKAHPDVFNLLLQILEDGVLTDTHNRQAHFRHTLIILTSNLGSEYLNAGTLGFLPKENPTDNRINQDLQEFFRPELLGRLTDIIHFQSFNETEVRQLIRRRLKQTKERLKIRGFKLTADTNAINWLAKRYNPDKGARSIDEIVKKEVEDLLVKTIAANTNIKVGKLIVTKRHLEINPW